MLPEYGKPRSPLVAVIGQDGGPCGLRLFSDLEAHRVWLEATANADAERGPTLPRHVALDFVAGAELADDVRTRIIANGWTVADDRAWPILRVTGTDGSVGKPPGGDVPAYEIILRAVTAALAEPEPWLRAWRDDDRHEATLHVDTSEDAFEVRVDTAAPEFMRLFDGDDAALLAAFERLDWSDDIEGVDGDRLATLERTLIARMRARSPELLPERPHAGIELLLAAGDWFGKPVTGLSAANVEYVVMELVPRHVAVRPHEARTALDQLGATLRWMMERHALAHGDACLELLAVDDTAERLAEALAVTDSFDVEKRQYMDGQAAGYDMDTDEGREGYLRQWRREKIASMMQPPAGDRYLDEPEGERARPSPAQRKKRKANRKAARKSRKKNR